jgi:protein-S-isoprenylcysteine O-methyltransferase Ste14
VDKFILLILAWALYFFVHSYLAGTAVKKRVEKHLWIFFRYYRLFYNTISIVSLLLLLFFNGSIPSPYVITPSGVSRYLSMAISLVGIFIIKAAFKQYSLREFTGFAHDRPDTFQSKGILLHIRHPLYAGTILITIGFWLFSPNVTTLISVGCIFVYLPIGIALEERKLILKYGEEYKEYRKKVPALLPKIKF